MAVSSVSSVPVTTLPSAAPTPSVRPATQATDSPSAPARDTVDLSAASLGQDAQPVNAAPTQEGRCGCEPTNHREGRAIRRAERQADRLVRAADKRLDRLAKVFDGDESAQKAIEALRSEFESQVRDATDAFVEDGGRDRRGLRAELREARKALREGIRDLIKSRLNPPTPPAPAPTPGPAPSETAPTEAPVAGSAGADGTATTSADISPAPAVPPPQTPAPEPVAPVGNPQPASPATTRLVVTYTAFQFTFTSGTDRIG